MNKEAFKIVFLGDSLTASYGVPLKKGWVYLLAEDYSWPCINKGLPGDTTAGMLARFQTEVIQERPQVVFLTGGVNDILLRSPYGAVMANMGAMIHQAWQHKMVPVTGICTAFVSTAAEDTAGALTEYKTFIKQMECYRKTLLQYLKAYGYRRFDFDLIGKEMDLFGRDGMHFSIEGNKAIAAAVNAYLEAMLEKKLDKTCMRWQFEQGQKKNR